MLHTCVKAVCVFREGLTCPTQRGTLVHFNQPSIALTQTASALIGRLYYSIISDMEPVLSLPPTKVLPPHLLPILDQHLQ